MSVDSTVPKIVAFETVHSMTGEICPLEELCEVIKYLNYIKKILLMCLFIFRYLISMER